MDNSTLITWIFCTFLFKDNHYIHLCLGDALGLVMVYNKLAI